MKLPACARLLVPGLVAGTLIACASARNLAPSATGTAGKDPTTGIVFVRVTGGTFNMGLNDGSANEKPVHPVEIRDFLIAKTEVTVRQFATFVQATGYRTDAEKAGGSRAWNGSNWVTVPGASWRTPVGPATDDLPAGYLSWNDAMAFCRWANMRLPTEAEWEYAAGGGGAHLCWAGTSHDAELADFAWFRLNAGKQLHPPGGKRPNHFGLHDMSGNVAEWCADWYGQNYYAESPPENPQGPRSGSARVLRGGSVYHDSTRVRITNRGMQALDYSQGAIGFRPCRDLAR